MLGTICPDCGQPFSSDCKTCAEKSVAASATPYEPPEAVARSAEEAKNTPPPVWLEGSDCPFADLYGQRVGNRNYAIDGLEWQISWIKAQQAAAKYLASATPRTLRSIDRALKSLIRGAPALQHSEAGLIGGEVKDLYYSRKELKTLATARNILTTLPIVQSDAPTCDLDTAVDALVCAASAVERKQYAQDEAVRKAELRLDGSRIVGESIINEYIRGQYDDYGHYEVLERDLEITRVGDDVFAVDGGFGYLSFRQPSIGQAESPSELKAKTAELRVARRYDRVLRKLAGRSLGRLLGIALNGVLGRDPLKAAAAIELIVAKLPDSDSTTTHGDQRPGTSSTLLPEELFLRLWSLFLYAASNRMRVENANQRIRFDEAGLYVEYLGQTVHGDCTYRMRTNAPPYFWQSASSLTPALQAALLRTDL